MDEATPINTQISFKPFPLKTHLGAEFWRFGDAAVHGDSLQAQCEDMQPPQITLKQAWWPRSADGKVWRLATTETTPVVPLKQQKYPFGG